MSNVDEKFIECVRIAVENGTFGGVAAILIVAVAIWAVTNTVLTTDLERYRISRGDK